MANQNIEKKPFFSKKMKVKIAVLFLAIVFLFVAKAFDNRQASKASELEAAAQKIAEEMGEEPGVLTGPAPGFTVQTASGEAVSLSSQLGKPAVLYFWSTWSDACQSVMPTFDALYESYGDQVNFLMVNLTDGKNDTVQSVTEFLSTGGFDFPVYYDINHEAEINYKVLVVPITVFLDAEGNVLRCVVEPMSPEALRAEVEALVK